MSDIDEATRITGQIVDDAIKGLPPSQQIELLRAYGRLQYEQGRRAAKAETRAADKPAIWPAAWKVEHDGFVGVEIGRYTTLEGKEGVVLQQVGTRVVHVYGRQRLKPRDASGE